MYEPDLTPLKTPVLPPPPTPSHFPALLSYPSRGEEAQAHKHNERKREKKKKERKQIRI